MKRARTTPPVHPAAPATAAEGLSHTDHEAPMTTEAIEMTSIRSIQLSRIQESNCNPRKTFTGIEELAADIERRGILQPVLVRPLTSPIRPVGIDFEMVFGTRRFRAAKLAKLSELPAMVRVMTDDEALETQLVENAKRVDVHPLEEADALEMLHARGHTQEQLADALGRDVGYVRRRLRLTGLVNEVRTMFQAGRLFVGHAELLASLARSLQAKAAKEIASDDPEREAMSVDRAREHVRYHFLLRLTTAPFDVADPVLVDGADACDKCPKNTNAQPDLFGNAASDAHCTDPECWHAKSKASFEKRAKAAKAAKLEVIRDPSKVFAKPDYSDDPTRLPFNSEFVDLDAETYATGKHTTYRELLGKHLPATFVVLAKDREGAGHDLLRKKDLATIAKAAGIKLGGSVDHSGAGSSHSSSKAKTGKAAERELETKARIRGLDGVLEGVVATVKKTGITGGHMRWICERVADLSYSGVREIERRRGIKAGSFATKNFAGRDLEAVIVEILVAEYFQDEVHDASELKIADGQLAPFKVVPSKIYSDARGALVAGREAVKPGKKAKPAPKKGNGAAKATPAKKTKRKGAGADARVEGKVT